MLTTDRVNSRGSVRDCKINGITSETKDAPVTVVTVDVSAESGAGGDEQLVRQLAARAWAEDRTLTGEDGLLARLTKVVVESALDGERDDHLGYGKHDPAGRNGGEFPEWGAVEDCADRGRAGGD